MPRALIPLTLLAGLLFARSIQAQAPPAAPPEALLLGQNVAEVRLVEVPDHLLAANPATIAIQPGRPLDRDVLRDSLRALYATGRYAQISAVAYAVPGGVRLDFLVRLNRFIGDVRFTGLDEPPSSSQALGALRLGLGETFHQSDLERGLSRVDELMHENGFFGTVFDPQLSPRPGTQLMDITVRAETGPRARLGPVGASNANNFPSDALVRISKLKPGQPLTAARLDKGAERVRKWLFRRGFYAARVTVHPGQYDASQNSVPITLEVSAGSPVKLQVSGAKLSSGRIRDLVPVFQEGSVDEDLLAEGRRNIRDYFERRGFVDCDVQYASTLDSGTGVRNILYTVTLGPRRRLAAVEFTGNKYFGDETLRSRLTIIPAEFLRSPVFSRRLLQQNEDSVRALYVSNGFSSAKVQSEVVEDFHGQSDKLMVRFHVEEGPQTLVQSLDITGNSVLTRENLIAVCGSTPGQPYSDANVASDRDNILALYLYDGMPNTSFEARVTPGSEPGQVKLTYVISEGERLTVARVLVGGSEHTRPGTIRRQIQLKPGEPLRESDVTLTQRDLYNLGIFNRVSVAQQNPQGDETDKTMLVNVHEGQRFTLGYGGGFEVQPINNSNNPTETTLDFAPRGILELSWNNVFGLAHTIEVRLRASTLQGRGLVEYSAPQLLGHRNLNLQLIGFAEKARDVRTFTSTRYEGTLQLEHRISPVTTFLYRYTYRHVLTSNLNIAPEEVPLFSQPTKVAGPSVAWVRDLRDNPADPSRGRFYTVDVSLYTRPLGSTANFIRIYMQNSSFTSLGHRLVFARSTRFGMETPFGSSSSNDIPLPERFFAGGGNSLRGFGLNQAGPRDTTTGFPVGGLVLLTSNQELRFPLRLPYTTAAVTGAFFYDVGNVYSSIRTVSFRTTPPPDDLNFLSHSVGFGIHYPTPVGPIRIDFGYLINSPQFTLPTAPGGLARQRHFQFFLSFGAPF